MIQLNEKTSIGQVLMAPLAGVTDRSFRTILKEQGADLTYTEMVSAKALAYANEKSAKLLEPAPGEVKLAVQLFGSEPQILAKVAEQVSQPDHVCLIDINMGCPAPKIIKNGEGASLMKDPRRAEEIIRQVVATSHKPVTCKFRRGFGLGDETAVEFARRMEGAGASLVTVHGRFRDQFYSGKSDRTIIGKVKAALNIPVIGNGDIFTAQDALDMFKETGCDGIMVARGALGNPFLFREIKGALKGEQVAPASPRERLEMARRHLKGAVAEAGEFVGVREMRKHLSWYFKGLPMAAAYRDRINRAEDLATSLAILNEYISQVENLTENELTPVTP